MLRAGVILFLACLAGCAGHEPRGRASPDVIASTGWTEDWAYAGHPGKLVRTPSYRFFTTATDSQLVEQMPRFLEASMERYTTAFGPLPRPVLRLDTFLMGDREQWQSLTRQVMGAEAATYLRIERGGFASGGRALLWSIGSRDTLAIAAHEGWHQYTQRAFRQELPAWLEEGIAVYMEGFVPDPADPSHPIFMGWANAERFEQLRRAAQTGGLMTISRLLAATPQDLIANSTEGTLTYYAELWALVLYLREGEDERYTRGLMDVVCGAAAGTLRSGLDPASVFRACTGSDPSGLEEGFARFVSQIVAAGSAESIGMGRSPIRGP